MKFAYHHSMCPADQYLPLTLAAESLGFDTVTMPDSICYPKEASSKYPYNADGSRDFLEGVPFIEPFVLASYLAAATKTIRFSTSVQKTAVHEPVLLAKTLSSLAVMSGNRFDFGMGISPWAEDFEVANTNWEKRGKRLTEMMQIINGLMVGDYFGFDGEIFQLPEIKLCPVPTVKPKLLVGGHSKPALRRAAQYGDGWIAAGGSVEEIQVLVETLQGFRREYGTDNKPFELQAMTAAAYSVDGVKQLEDIGITELIVAFRDVYAKEADDKSVEEKRGMMEWYANEIISKSK